MRPGPARDGDAHAELCEAVRESADAEARHGRATRAMRGSVSRALGRIDAEDGTSSSSARALLEACRVGSAAAVDFILHGDENVAGMLSLARPRPERAVFIHALHLAIVSRHDAAIESLLRSGCVDVNETVSLARGRTTNLSALHLAAAFGTPRSVGLLLAFGADAAAAALSARGGARPSETTVMAVARDRRDAAGEVIAGLIDAVLRAPAEAAAGGDLLLGEKSARRLGPAPAERFESRGAPYSGVDGDGGDGGSWPGRGPQTTTALDLRARPAGVMAHHVAWASLACITYWLLSNAAAYLLPPPHGGLLIPT